jgi:hypothetical protein
MDCHDFWPNEDYLLFSRIIIDSGRIFRDDSRKFSQFLKIMLVVFPPVNHKIFPSFEELWQKKWLFIMW